MNRVAITLARMTLFTSGDGQVNIFPFLYLVLIFSEYDFLSINLGWTQTQTKEILTQCIKRHGKKIEN